VIEDVIDDHDERRDQGDAPVLFAVRDAAQHAHGAAPDHGERRDRERQRVAEAGDQAHQRGPAGRAEERRVRRRRVEIAGPNAQLLVEGLREERRPVRGHARHDVTVEVPVCRGADAERELTRGGISRTHDRAQSSDAIVAGRQPEPGSASEDRRIVRATRHG
jgi:hypothetical protein